MKLLFRILIYLSLAFLVYYLYKFDYLTVSNLDLNLVYLIPATLLLWAGFVMSTVSWWKALDIHGIHVSKRLSLVSHGLSIFAKYIPGKVWVILGRASFVSMDRYSVRDASYISLKEQLIYVWLGLVIGIGPMLYFYTFNSFVILVLLLSVFFTFFLYSKSFHRFVIQMLSKVIRKKLDVPLVTIREVIPLVMYVLSYWVLWMIAFYFFVLSFDLDFSIIVVFCWPLSISLGVLALITPGGIGVREGIMTGFMVMTGMPLETATTIAVLSRLWFITGEIFIFLLSLVLNKFSLRH
ncbi:MAG: hypothetical protein DRJ15_05125 [Bacteroidetes bacterium]|nr:MAG: hypothetical protein DRI83_00055 [Bacteroidota bacterium]RLD81191.1 MAG: hypothetical protein DRJ15_05125 [Bacteroidota bacterium]